MSRAPRPVLSVPVSSEPLTPVQDGTGCEERSLGKVIPSQNNGLMGVPVDLHRFRVVFPDKWMALLRASFRSIEHAAFELGYTYKTVENWWHGRTAGSGPVVAHMALRDPRLFASVMLDDRMAA